MISALKTRILAACIHWSLTYLFYVSLGFVDFCAEDQATLIRLGQSSTRILAACIHWSLTYLFYVSLGFVDFCAEDQATLIRLGQSSTRILAACIHWYDADLMDFRNFLSWRSSDLFKMKSVRHAQRMHALDIDHIEAALLNVATLIATGTYVRASVSPLISVYIDASNTADIRRFRLQSTTIRNDFSFDRYLHLR